MMTGRMNGLAGKALVVEVHPLAGGGHGLVHDPRESQIKSKPMAGLFGCV